MGKYRTLGQQLGLQVLCSATAILLPSFIKFPSSSHPCHAPPSTILKRVSSDVIRRSVTTGLCWPKALSARILPFILTSYLLHVNKTKIINLPTAYIFLTSVPSAYYLVLVFTFRHLDVVFGTIMTENDPSIRVFSCTTEFPVLVD